MLTKTRVHGFSLVEVMVVVGIIVMMLTIILVSISETRKNSRDKSRIGDLSELEFALSLYKEKNRDYPTYDEGVEIGVGEPIDAELLQFWPKIKSDPKNNGVSNGPYGYWYQSDFECGGTSHIVVIARTMERGDWANYEEVCGPISDVSSMKDFFIQKAHAGGKGGGGGSKPPNYSQASYYSESSYYTQSVYGAGYSQASYYSEGGYSSQSLDLTSDELSGMYIVIIE